LRLRWLGVALALLAGCGSGDGEGDRGVEPAPAEALIGTWRTEGLDETLGEVEVLMRLEADGRLTMTVLMAGGGQQNFPGTWAVEGGELVLKGAYFAPAGESRVRWSIGEDGYLVLEDEGGRRQEWTREP